MRSDIWNTLIIIHMNFEVNQIDKTIQNTVVVYKKRNMSSLLLKN